MYCSTKVSPMMNQRIASPTRPTVSDLQHGGQESRLTHSVFLLPNLSALAGVLGGLFSMSDIRMQGINAEEWEATKVGL